MGSFKMRLNASVIILVAFLSQKGQGQLLTLKPKNIKPCSIVSSFPKPCLNPNGAVYTKTGGDNFVQLSCGFHNSIFQNTSRTPISECLWTRTIQSGKNSSSVLFTCKKEMDYQDYRDLESNYLSCGSGL